MRPTLPGVQVGYPCLSLHGGKDQLDRESTIKDFKTDVCNLLVATSVAARGLDVKDLKLVVNYVVPNHHEDYVHRVGRTGAPCTLPAVSAGLSSALPALAVPLTRGTCPRCMAPPAGQGLACQTLPGTMC